MAKPSLKQFFALTLTVALGSAILPAAAQENLDGADTATRQLPRFQDYPADMLTRPHEFSYADPATGNKVVKLTDSHFPGQGPSGQANRRGYHDYSEGGPYISSTWGDRMHTIAVRHEFAPGQGPNGSTWAVYLVDYQRETGLISNARLHPYSAVLPAANNVSFSNKPGEERMMYAVVEENPRKLIKMSTATMQVVDSVSLPATTNGVPTGQPKWLQISEGDRRIVFATYQTDGSTTVHVYSDVNNSGLTLQNRQHIERTFTNIDIDEPALDRGGQYVQLRFGSRDIGTNGCHVIQPPPQPPAPQYYPLENRWLLWNLQTNDQPECRGGNGFYGAHTGWVKGYFPNQDAHNSAETFYYDPVSNSRQNITQYASPNYFFANHYTAQWIQPAGGTSQWYFGSNDQEGEVHAQGWAMDPSDPTVIEASPGTWTQSGSNPNIYSAALNYAPAWQKLSINAAAVYQMTSATKPRRLSHTLAPTTPAAPAEGTFYYDQTAQRIYVWLVGGGNPTGRVQLAIPGPVHNGIGAKRLNDQVQAKLIAHTYSWANNLERKSRVTVSPDGRLAMFDSTMGWDKYDLPPDPAHPNRPYDQSERTDVFVVEIPRGQSSGGGTLPAGGEPVVWANPVRATASGNTLTKNCTNCLNGGADSQQQLLSGEGYVEFTAVVADVFSVGIGTGPASTDPNDTEFALRFHANGRVETRVDGLYRGDFPYAAGDRFRIAVEEGDVNFYKVNGTVLQPLDSLESPALLQYPLKVEGIVMADGTSIGNAVVAQTSGGGGQPPAGGAITWTNASNAIVDGNSLTQNGGANGGAQSVEALTGPGYMEFTAVETTKMRAVGLDYANTGNNFEEIDFAIVLRQTSSNGKSYAEVRESGLYKADVEYGPNTRFRISIENGVAKYYKYVNGVPALIFSGAAVSSFPVHVDAALYDPQSTIEDVTLTAQ